MATQDIQITTTGTTTGTAASEGSSGCGCCGGATPAGQVTTAEVGAGSTTKQYAVAGMTCGHCVDAVTRELDGLAGVDRVVVDLVVGGTSTVTVTSAGHVSDEVVTAAIDEAGYTVVPV